MTNKLVLGTVQFGLNYGINNQCGRPDEAEIDSILNFAYQHGIVTLDTSYAYGNSEHVLGAAIKRVQKPFRIISKLPETTKDIEIVFQESLSNLQTDRLYGYLIHHFHFFKEHPEIWGQIRGFKEKGLIEKTGFSIYSPGELEFLLEQNIEFELIQFPYNVLDRQFEPWLLLLKEKGVEIHVRSTFLQGLFFMDRNKLPEKLQPLRPYLMYLDSYAEEQGMTIAEVALNYNLQNPLLDGILIGVDNARQLRNNINTISDKNVQIEMDVKEKELLNPVNWK